MDSWASCEAGSDARRASAGKDARTSSCLSIEPSLLISACFSGAIAIHDAAFGEVIRRKLDVDAIAGKNLDAMAA